LKKGRLSANPLETRPLSVSPLLARDTNGITIVFGFNYSTLSKPSVLGHDKETDPGDKLFFFFETTFSFSSFKELQQIAKTNMIDMMTRYHFN
jgi:hypothetical protein